jgi:hypothetical protein
LLEPFTVERPEFCVRSSCAFVPLRGDAAPVVDRAADAIQRGIMPLEPGCQEGAVAKQSYSGIRRAEFAKLSRAPI